MEPQEVMGQLFDEKIIRILKYFFRNQGDFYLREIARQTSVSVTSTYRILNKLLELDILNEKSIKTARLYTLNQSKTTEFLKSILEVDVLQYYIDNLTLTPVEQIILLGPRSDKKANVLLLGENLDAGKLKLLSAEIKEKYDFTINHMVLTKEQYEQMSAMGLYPGSKRILYSSKQPPIL